MDLDVVLSESVPLPAKASNGNGIEKAVADLICDVCLSHPSALHAVNAFSVANSDDNRPLEID